MLIGFQDDPGFRWSPDRGAMITAAARAHATVIRATADWSQIAPTRPRLGIDAFDPAYNFTDLDDLTRTAAMNGMTVMLTIWGTPAWANDGRGPNYLPKHMRDLSDFAQAIAERYSGRHPGYPFVGYYTIWNEPNWVRFLAPAYDADGNPVSPNLYAVICRFVYGGLKAGNPFATVAIGQTSSRGNQVQRPGAGSIAPGTFARLLADVKPAVPFDAWAHHPYSDLGYGPHQRYRFPNVNLATLHTFEQKFDLWFHRDDIPIWISEYGIEPRPGRPRRRDGRPAGGVRPAGARDRGGRPARADVHLVHAPRRPRVLDLGQRPDRRRRVTQARFRCVRRCGRRARRPKPGGRGDRRHDAARAEVARLWELASARRCRGQARLGDLGLLGPEPDGIGTPEARIGVDGYASFRLPIRRVRAGARYR